MGNIGPVPQYSVSLVDVHIETIMKSLVKNLYWLDVAYGRAQRITRTVGSKTYKAPAVYYGYGYSANDKGEIEKVHENYENEYLEMLPDSGIGNFSFFYMLEPQVLHMEFMRQGYIQAPFALIFWLDFTKIYGAPWMRNTEAIKAQIIKCLNRKTTFSSNCSLELTKVYETAEQIYKEFTIDEVDNQFLMHPFFGFRFEGILKFEEPC